MAKSLALAADASRLASLLLSYIPPVCAFVAPRHQGASTAIIDRLSHSRALSRRDGARPFASVRMTLQQQPNQLTCVRDDHHHDRDVHSAIDARLELTPPGAKA